MPLGQQQQQRPLRAHLTMELLPVGVLQFDRDRQVVYANAMARRLLGDAASTHELVARTVPEDRDALLDGLDAALRDGDDRAVEVRMQSPGDPTSEPGAGPAGVYEVTVRNAAAPLGRRSPVEAVCCITDVTARAEERRRLEALARHDDLTSTLNRAATVAALEAALDARAEDAVAALYVDLDRFKGINDRHGHAVGDRVLRIVADRLRAAVRADDVVGRVGGDEFLVVCPAVRDLSAVRDLQRRITATLNIPAAVDDLALPTGASVGVAVSADPDESAELLIARADAAMYRAKRDRGRPNGLALPVRPGIRRQAGPTAGSRPASAG